MARFWKPLPLAALILCAVGTISAGSITVVTPNLLLPGTPCPVGAAPAACTADLLNTDLVNDPGTNILGAFVVPGDVVVFETPDGSLTGPQTSWSDVVHFQDTPTGSVAILFADNENGVILPPGFALSANAVGVVELQQGHGNDALDVTQYSPDGGTTVYNIHSDAAGNEIPDPETPEPSTLVLLGSGLAVASLYRLRRA